MSRDGVVACIDLLEVENEEAPFPLNNGVRGLLFDGWQQSRTG